MTHQRLYINIDHIATVRQARRGAEPVPANAVTICERAGADGIERTRDPVPATAQSASSVSRMVPNSVAPML
jgi:hypothetical protein